MVSVCRLDGACGCAVGKGDGAVGIQVDVPVIDNFAGIHLTKVPQAAAVAVGDVVLESAVVDPAYIVGMVLDLGP